MAKYALLQGATVVNIVEWDGSLATWNPAPLTAVLYNPLIHILAPPVEGTNQMTLQANLRAALTANVTFLAIANPTAAQVATQSKALTRQVDALIRLVLPALDSTAGT